MWGVMSIDGLLSYVFDLNGYLVLIGCVDRVC